ncbi:MAG: ytvI, partial [Clostridiales bacterium]|nr:ytvI [Clostridiales bacterium]
MYQKRFQTGYILRMALFILVILLILVISVKLGLFLIPFVIALVISLLIEPIVKFLMERVRIPRKASSAISVLLVLSVVGTLLTVLISKLIDEIVTISHFLPKYYSEINNNINNLISRGTDIYIALPPEVTNNIQGLLRNLTTNFIDMLNRLIKGIFNTAISIPEALIFTLVTIISTYFFSSDRDMIYNYFRSHLPDHWMKKIGSVKIDLFSALFGYIRAQLILMTITFTELFVGFSIIGIKYSLLLAFVIAIIDALPILGTGGVLIPWALYEFLVGNVRTALSLLVLYLIVLIVRQLTEPKVLSQQIGLHPLVTLSAMYTGLRLF